MNLKHQIIKNNRDKQKDYIKNKKNLDKDQKKILKQIKIMEKTDRLFINKNK
ncbi:Hypothetical protein KVN_LOCUS107 [uncultured virus]|nr:Hypothetical protein KVN_LOCUS107 [uncultured virus]